MGVSSQGLKSGMSGIIAFLSLVFGLFLRWAGFEAFEAVLIGPLVAAVSLFGFVLLESLIFGYFLSVGAS